MYRKKPEVDIIKDVLDAALIAYPASTFVKSLAFQYEERGGLSKKQLEGLYGKAKNINGFSTAKLATLEAEILKRPNRYKSTTPTPTPLYNKDESVGNKINTILAKYPQHKRVLFFRSKFNNNEIFSAAELTELDKFSKLLQK
jgi:hypothetical protein